MSGGRHPAFTGDGPVGKSLPRQTAARIVQGGGRYLDDIVLPRMLHVAFLRSPFAHGRILGIDTEEAAAMPGVVRVVTAADLERVFSPMVAQPENLPQHKPAEQFPLARDKVRWQGEPVAAVVASSRAAAEDAVDLIYLDIEDLPAVADIEAALADDAPLVHEAHGDNVTFEMARVFGTADALGAAETVIEQSFYFGRQTGVSLETRGAVAQYDRASENLTVHLSHQQPHMMQALIAQHLSMPEARVRVISPDVGGAFGLKLHAYPDEMAVAAIARLLGRPVKWSGDRLEAFAGDAHSREFAVEGRVALDGGGRVVGFGADVAAPTGAFPIYPRASIGDAFQAATMVGAPYRFDALDARLRVLAQNKPPTGPYRGVGQPIATAVTEQLMDAAAVKLGQDPADFRRAHYWRPEDLPATTVGGLVYDGLSLVACHDKLLDLMDYRALRADQAAARARGVWRGIGLSTFVEVTAPGAGLYGPVGIPVTAQDEAKLSIDPGGAVRGSVGCSDQGQGTTMGLTQIVAGVLGVAVEDVQLTLGDSAAAYGGGAWASRGIAIGGEAAYRAATVLKANLLSVAGAILQADPAALDLRRGHVVDATDGTDRMTIAELCRMAHFRQDLLPPDVHPELSATASYVPRDLPYFVANGIQASHLELDADTGAIRLLGHWVVEDCGRVINPLLVDEQIRGGVVQGLGAALYEECVYDADGQLLTGSMVDYLVPMAAEMPDIVVGHVETPQSGTALGAKGAGEAGVVGAIGAVWGAVNDALAPSGTRVAHQPFTPERILSALGKLG